MRIDGEKIRKIGSEKGIFSDRRNLWKFAFDNREVLEADDRIFCVKLDINPSELDQAGEILERMNARPANVEVRDGEVLALAYDETGLSEWIVDMWNCRGILKPRKWGVGHGREPDITKYGLRWENAGQFTVPTMRILTKKERKEIEKILGGFVEITRDGIHSVKEETLERLKKLGVVGEFSPKNVSNCPTYILRVRDEAEKRERPVYILRDQFDREVVRVVIGASSPDEALKIARERGEEFDTAERISPYFK